MHTAWGAPASCFGGNAAGACRTAELPLLSESESTSTTLTLDPATERAGSAVSDTCAGCACSQCF